MNFLPKDLGGYPKEYDREVHGTYNPSLYYGKRDTPFFDVKLKDLGAWIGRRNKSPRAMVQAWSRLMWRHNLAWEQPLKPGFAFLWHKIFFVSAIFYFLSYDSLKKERRYRYH